jgi:8-oxo-dGTP diphosphatase
VSISCLGLAISRHRRYGGIATSIRGRGAGSRSCRASISSWPSCVATWPRGRPTAHDGVDDVYLEQLYTFGTLGRDPRERIVTVAYYALAKLSDHRIRAATDAMGVGWFALDDLPKLAFDHDEIVTRAHDRLRGKVRYAPVGFELLPPRFSLTQLQRLYEIILGTELDKRNFRKKILSLDLVVETDEVEQGVRHRAARLYRFDRRKYERQLKQGFELSI